MYLCLYYWSYIRLNDLIQVRYEVDGRIQTRVVEHSSAWVHVVHETVQDSRVFCCTQIILEIIKYNYFKSNVYKELYN
jgi:hypothetical protein